MDNVALIDVLGVEAATRFEDLFDGIMVGDGSDVRRHITTSSHESETLDDVIESTSG